MQSTEQSAAIASRMVNQQLWAHSAADIPDIVRSFVGMQAQEFQYALWSIAQRMTAPVTRDVLLHAFDDGTILRTHVLRPTWHFVLPEDTRRLLRLTSPKLRRLMASYSRLHGLDAAELSRSQRVLSRTVRGGNHSTRKDLAAALESAGVATGGLRLGFILMHAEYDEVLISGARQGKQQTYAAFDERVPAGSEHADNHSADNHAADNPAADNHTADNWAADNEAADSHAADNQAADSHPADIAAEDEALAALAGRFVATRAPVTAKDLAGWASLTLGQVRRGLAAIETDCTVTEVDGLTLWSGLETPVVPDRDGPRVDLIQGYDELIMSYFESRRLLAPKGVLPVPDRTVHLHVILVDGQLAGHWRHQLDGAGALIQVQLHRVLTDDERSALEAAVHRYGDYLGVPATLAEPVLLA